MVSSDGAVDQFLKGWATCAPHAQEKCEGDFLGNRDAHARSSEFYYFQEVDYLIILRIILNLCEHSSSSTKS